MIYRLQILKAIYKQPLESEILLNDNDVDFSTYLCVIYCNALYYQSISDYESSIDLFNKYIYKCNLDKKYKFTDNLRDQCIKRNDRIKMHQIKSSFKYDYIDWDDIEWVDALIEYFYVCSLEEVWYMKMEMALVKSEKKTEKEMDILQVSGINRRDILTTRIRPKWTLEEYGQMVSDHLKEALATGDNNRSLAEGIKIEEDLLVEEKTLNDLREEDEIRDTYHITRGNTDNMG